MVTIQEIAPVTIRSSWRLPGRLFCSELVSSRTSQTCPSHLEDLMEKCLTQLNQIESIDNKVIRMKKFKKVVENKVEKVAFFENVTEILLEAMGKSLSFLSVLNKI